MAAKPFSPEYQPKLETIFDGIDTEVWRPRKGAEPGSRRIADREIPAGTKIVTYVSRGFESMRGFDVFMKVAKRIRDRRDDVVFVCVGSDRICYGGDDQYIEEPSFREHVLAQDDFDMSRFLFTGQVPPMELARILSLGDLHIYLTVPFVLSWSLMNALACGCTVLASDTEPVREMIEHGRNGLLAPFYDVDGFVALAMDVLDDPAAYRRLGEAGVEMVESHYSLKAVLPRMLDLYQRTICDRQCHWRSQAEGLAVEVGGDAPTWERLEGLPGRLSWPAAPPGVEPSGDGVHVRPALRRFLEAILNEDTRLVVEVNAWIGLSTRAIAELAPGATLVTIEPWTAEPDRHGGSAWKNMLPHVYERFLANCWPYRDRVVPISAAVAERLRTLCARGLKPDFVCFWPEHTATLGADIGLAIELFPESEVIGSHWRWPRARRAIERHVESDFLELAVEGDLWRIWREEAARI